MQSASWLPSWVDLAWTLAIVSAVGVFFRERLAKFLDAKVQHRLNAELEGLKDELARSSKEIEALRSSSLSLSASRQAILDKRRLDAVDDIWSAVKALKPLASTLMFLSAVKFEAAAERAKADPKVRDIFKLIDGPNDANRLKIEHKAHNSRPYVSPISWALFEAYQSTLAYGVMQMSVLKNGVDKDVIKDPSDIIALLSTALPDWSGRLKEHGSQIFSYVVDELEEKLLVELRKTISGEGDDQALVERAAKISALVTAAERHAVSTKLTGGSDRLTEAVGEKMGFGARNQPLGGV